MVLSFEYPPHSSNATIQDSKIELSYNQPKDISENDNYENIESKSDESKSESNESKDEYSEFVIKYPLDSLKFSFDEATKILIVSNFPYLDNTPSISCTILGLILSQSLLNKKQLIS
ncbi:11286_t:CDS:2 [Racocetra persica]|uniref:11286_t:CDS:1 n=1 Tax=Racocetra persica TaxID=160502 RepID=A0ACA9QYG6_9GLOM|nr:11286_t:CDS:2 [Racocetra persica]